MTHVGHLFDASAGWEQRVGVSQLIEGLPRHRFVNSLMAIGPAARTSLRWLRQPVDLLPWFHGIASLAAPVVARSVTQQRIDVIHAWGIGAAVAARALPGIPLVVQLFDPCTAVREVKRVRALTRPSTFAVACSSEIVRRRLIEGGLNPELAVVIRPGVDFSLINRCRRGPLREELGLTWDESVAIVPEPVTRAGGQFDAAYAVTLHHHLLGGTRVIVPGTSREQRRILRFTGTLPLSNALVTPGDRHPFEELLAVSDVLLLTPRGDISATSVAWAMAAGVAVIATAVHSVAEVIASRVNGLLFKQVPDQSMIASIIGLLQDRASQEKAKETARGQAYKVFGLRRYVEQTTRLYENVLSRAAPGEGITDSAIDI